MSAVEAPRGTRRVEVLDLVLSWTAGLVGYLVAEYGAGALLVAAVDGGSPQALPAWTWLPWIAGPVLCGALAAAVLPLWRGPALWHWLVAGGAVPLLAAPVTMFVVGVADVGSLLLGVGVQVVVAALVAAGVGLLRRAVEPALAARRATTPVPVTYTS